MSKRSEKCTFVPPVHPRTYHNYGMISGRHTSRDRLWPLILVAELNTTSRGEQLLNSHQVQCNIPTFEALLRKTAYLFTEQCKKFNNVWLRALMQSDYNRILRCD